MTDRATVRTVVAELRDRGDLHEAERFLRQAALQEARVLARAAAAAEASRDRRRRAREAQRNARSELERELQAPLIEGSAR